MEPIHNTNLLPENYENIMLYLNLKDIYRLCRINTSLQHICKNNNFWYRKFTLDYNFITAKSNHWEKEYVAVYNASIQAYELINKLLLFDNKSRGSHSFMIQIPDVKYVDMFWVPNFLLYDEAFEENIHNLFFYVCKSSCNKKTIMLGNYDKKSDLLINNRITIKEFIDFLTKLLYYHNNVDFVNEKDESLYKLE